MLCPILATSGLLSHLHKSRDRFVTDLARQDTNPTVCSFHADQQLLEIVKELACGTLFLAWYSVAGVLIRFGRVMSTLGQFCARDWLVGVGCCVD